MAAPSPLPSIDAKAQTQVQWLVESSRREIYTVRIPRTILHWRGGERVADIDHALLSTLVAAATSPHKALQVPPHLPGRQATGRSSPSWTGGDCGVRQGSWRTTWTSAWLLSGTRGFGPKRRVLRPWNRLATVSWRTTVRHNVAHWVLPVDCVTAVVFVAANLAHHTVTRMDLTETRQNAAKANLTPWPSNCNSCSSRCAWRLPSSGGVLVLGGQAHHRCSCRGRAPPPPPP